MTAPRAPVTELSELDSHFGEYRQFTFGEFEEQAEKDESVVGGDEIIRDGFWNDVSCSVLISSLQYLTILFFRKRSKCQDLKDCLDLSKRICGASHLGLRESEVEQGVLDLVPPHKCLGLRRRRVNSSPCQQIGRKVRYTLTTCCEFILG